MDFLELARKRCSIRKYSRRGVEEEKMVRILQAARVAPTAANLQPVRLIAVRSAEGLERIAAGANVYGAPLAIIVCADHGRAWTRPFDGKQTCDTDASILTDHMMLEATAQGLGSVWIDYFKPDVIRRAFGLEEGVEPIHILAIGYADEAPASPDRHAQTRIPLEELVSYA